MAEQSGEKTEKATPYRRKKAREEGQVAKSMDVNSAGIMLLFAVFLYLLQIQIINYLEGFFRFTFTNLLTPDLISYTLIYEYLKGVLLVIIVLSFGALIFNIAQIGFLFTFKPLVPNLSKLNPIEGIKRIFSIRSVFELIKGTLKIGLLGIVLVLIFINDIDIYISSINFSKEFLIVFMIKEILKFLMFAVLVYIFIAVIDFLYQKWDYEKKLKMTKQEIKEEYKQREGRPEVKAAIKRKQRELASRRMMQEVPNADVIITNPTHIAVALKYDINEDDAPKVIAKGTDNIAQKIKEIAKENDIPIVENKELARELYYNIDLEEEIPEEYYKAVAEILAFVFQLKNKHLKK